MIPRAYWRNPLMLRVLTRKHPLSPAARNLALSQVRNHRPRSWIYRVGHCMCLGPSRIRLTEFMISIQTYPRIITKTRRRITRKRFQITSLPWAWAIFNLFQIMDLDAAETQGESHLRHCLAVTSSSWCIKELWINRNRRRCSAKAAKSPWLNLKIISSWIRRPRMVVQANLNLEVILFLKLKNWSRLIESHWFRELRMSRTAKSPKPRMTSPIQKTTNLKAPENQRIPKTENLQPN